MKMELFRHIGRPSMVLTHPKSRDVLRYSGNIVFFSVYLAVYHYDQLKTCAVYLPVLIFEHIFK